ncbi:MAG: energy transducer TonB [Spirochaetes bacterium]|nr:energy transducer TonB [Spirochaetota bacterium]MBN2769893.1 energy transducer TonB [Spirochaetota bacterium]
MNRFLVSLYASALAHFVVFGIAKYYSDANFFTKPGIKQQNSLQEVTVNIISDSSEFTEPKPTENIDRNSKSSFTVIFSNKEASFFIKNETLEINEDIKTKKTSSKKNNSALSALTRLADILAHNNPPNYPYSARRFGHEGEVILEIEITSDGKSGHVSVVKSSGYPSLDRAAIDAARGWIFFEGESPFNGSSFKITQTIRFRLN